MLRTKGGQRRGHLAPRVTTVHPHLIKFIVLKIYLSLILSLTPILTPFTTVHPHLPPLQRICCRNDLKSQLDQVWTMRGQSFANLKEERGTKERPPGPEGDHRPPPPPTPATTKVRYYWWGSLCGAYLIQPRVKLQP